MQSHFNDYVGHLLKLSPGSQATFLHKETNFCAGAHFKLHDGAASVTAHLTDAEPPFISVGKMTPEVAQFVMQTARSMRSVEAIKFSPSEPPRVNGHEILTGSLTTPQGTNLLQMASVMFGSSARQDGSKICFSQNFSDYPGAEVAVSVDEITNAISVTFSHNPRMHHQWQPEICGMPMGRGVIREAVRFLQKKALPMVVLSGFKLREGWNLNDDQVGWRCLLPEALTPILRREAVEFLPAVTLAEQLRLEAANAMFRPGRNERLAQLLGTALRAAGGPVSIEMPVQDGVPAGTTITASIADGFMQVSHRREGKESWQIYSDPGTPVSKSSLSPSLSHVYSQALIGACLEKYANTTSVRRKAIGSVFDTIGAAPGAEISFANLRHENRPVVQSDFDSAEAGYTETLNVSVERISLCARRELSIEGVVVQNPFDMSEPKRVKLRCVEADTFGLCSLAARAGEVLKTTLAERERISQSPTDAPSVGAP